MNHEPREGFTLWHRPSRRHKWRPVGTGPTQFHALLFMDGAGYHAGHWIVRPVPNDPNEDEASLEVRRSA